ncbi:MAG: exo-beta-N-acetylmuramidase NamZ domain-containing protein [Acidobacteriota bacterium]|nr:exo-beta-N-acetylmuramidase NamZ domain-containing protein [Acidobacteriota bacterium]
MPLQTSVSSHTQRVAVSGVARAAVALIWLGQLAGVAFAQIDRSRLDRIDTLIDRAIEDKRLPGAVIAVGHGGELVYERAFGARALEPVAEAMTPDTVFDLASLTKVVATTTSVMRLVEDGQLRLRDRVSRFIPEFETQGRDGVTIEHLLTHTSGLAPDLPLEEEFVGWDTAISRTLVLPPMGRAGEQFIYSDLNFILLGEIVQTVSGLPLDQFAREQVFDPLGMTDTRFIPASSLLPRIAPTEACAPLAWPCGGPGAVMLRGVVHDPTARRRGGVAGHAGLFSTVRDLSRFCAMLLGEGRLDGVRVLSPPTVARMTRLSTPDQLVDRRGLGWDIDSRFSSNRGDLFARGSYGHTGFTGTSLWIDPASKTFVVFLSSRVHPSGTGNVTRLRGQVATVVASALGDARPAMTAQTSPNPVRTGVDRLREERFGRLAGRRVGLVTNQTGRAQDGVSTIDLLAAAPGVELVALFSPEHGIRGTLDEVVPSGHDLQTGLFVHSLYGGTRRPTASMVEGLDTIVVDLQDVGARFYTYVTTMAYVLEAAAAHALRVVVLDRPNPIGGTRVEGPLLDVESLGFTGYMVAPVRHGLTMGELARLFNVERGIDADLHVVPMEGWRRTHWFDQTGLPWIDPSPNMRNLHQALLYPGIGAIETSNLSVGRGTDSPFEQIGAPWIDGRALARALNQADLPGLRVYPVEFVPESSRFAGERCHGVFFVVTDREALHPVRVGLEVTAALYRRHGDQFDLDALNRLFGSRYMLEQIRAGVATADIAAGWEAGVAVWRRLTAKYLLYE